MVRNLTIGSEWLYYKIYCGYATADNIIHSVILPISQELIIEEKVINWFFIRYTDPLPHIRWRLHLSKADLIGEVISYIYQTIYDSFYSGQINNVMLDTYKREIERYGEDSIGICEEIFGVDSAMVASFLSINKDNQEKETLRWLFALKSIDGLFDDFGYSVDKRYRSIKQLGETFGQEFGLSSNNKELSSHYRQSRQQIIKFLENNGANADEYEDLIRHRSRKLIDLANKLSQMYSDERTDDILHSIIHMAMNRLLLTRPRMHEAVLYYYLSQYYKSVLYKMGHQI